VGTNLGQLGCSRVFEGERRGSFIVRYPANKEAQQEPGSRPIPKYVQTGEGRASSQKQNSLATGNMEGATVSKRIMNQKASSKCGKPNLKDIGGGWPGHRMERKAKDCVTPREVARRLCFREWTRRTKEGARRKGKTKQRGIGKYMKEGKNQILFHKVRKRTKKKKKGVVDKVSSVSCQRHKKETI